MLGMEVEDVVFEADFAMLGIFTIEQFNVVGLLNFYGVGGFW